MSEVDEVQKLVAFLRSVSNFMALPVEKNFDSKRYTEWTAKHWNVCIIALFFYSAMIRFGPGIMTDGLFLKRKTYEVVQVAINKTTVDGKEEVKETETSNKHKLTAISLKDVPDNMEDLLKPHKLKGKSQFAIGDKVVFLPKNSKVYVQGKVISSSGADLAVIKKPSKAFVLRTPLAIWNFGLSFFSFIGMMRTVPTLLANLLEYKSIKDTICLPARALNDGTPHWGMGPTGLWVMLFIFSKLPELVDTLFIVLRMKPLIFLHWYHHITVLAFCWSAYATNAAIGLYFVGMNYTVHAMMYGYYCLQALEKVPKWFPTIIITSSQITQMLIGTAVCVAAWYYHFVDAADEKLAPEYKCQNQMTNLCAGGLMYASYLYLFVEFAVGKYFRPKGGKDKDV